MLMLPEEFQSTSKSALSRFVDLEDFIGPSSRAEIDLARDLTHEQKLALVDLMIAKGIEAKRLRTLGYLLEFREGIIQEKYVFPEEYNGDKKKIIDSCEKNERAARNRGDEQEADSWFFNKINRIIVLQNTFLRSVCPVRLVFTSVEAF